ncbi:hypothetical protein MMC06_001667 [Schaereria dolodes]|nr:hypothetical protein [Schaereria dolodes]
MSPLVHSDHRFSPLQPPPSRFLSLPPEIRNQIVSYLITDTVPITIKLPHFNRYPRLAPIPIEEASCSSSSSSDPPPPGPSPLPHKNGYLSLDHTPHTRLAIIQTCRLLYHSHRHTYYSSNTFILTTSTLARLLFTVPSPSLPTPCLDAIRSLNIHKVGRDERTQLYRLLTKFRGLEELELWLYVPSTTHFADEWKRLEKGLRDVRHLGADRLRLVRLRREPRGSPKEKRGFIEETDAVMELRINQWLGERTGMESGP